MINNKNITDNDRKTLKQELAKLDDAKKKEDAAEEMIKMLMKDVLKDVIVIIGDRNAEIVLLEKELIEYGQILKLTEEQLTKIEDIMEETTDIPRVYITMVPGISYQICSDDYYPETGEKVEIF